MWVQVPYEIIMTAWQLDAYAMMTIVDHIYWVE